MTTKILICDDSAMARKQMARALPDTWAVEVTFAGDGKEGLAIIREGSMDLVFLDLNMPVMDGYEVLETLQKEGLKANLVVVSGDIQPKAYKRVLSMGALAFIKKPASTEKIAELATQLQIDIAATDTAASSPGLTAHPADIHRDYRDCYQEITNVAMGQAASLLARVLDVYIRLPIPNVNMIELAELQMALTTAEDATVSAVCQGFIGSGVAGEALLIFNDSSFSDIAELMKYTGELDTTAELELLMDMASILISAFLKGIAEQLDVYFSQGRPVVLGRHVPLENLLENGRSPWKKTLSIEISYAIEDHDIYCDLLILFTEESLEIINKKLAYLFD